MNLIYLFLMASEALDSNLIIIIGIVQLLPGGSQTMSKREPT